MVHGGDSQDAQPTRVPDAQDAARTLAPDAQDAMHRLAPGAPVTPPPRDIRTHADSPAQVTLLPPSQVAPAPPRPAGHGTYMTYGALAPTVANLAALKKAEVIGDFELIEPLGEGGMGVVYRARQRALDRLVALKVLTPRSATTAEAAERFAREARAAAAINHPNVITIIAAGRDEQTGRLYMAMELVRGGDVEQLAHAAGGKLPERRALEVLRDCARGLVAVERAGLVHRDIKPQNIFVTVDGVAKLADLGLARTQAGDDRVTQTGLVVGTPAFMSPEQAQGSLELDTRTDIYALGATLYRLLTGLAPYEGSSVMAILTKVVRDAIPDPRARTPSVSARTADVVLKAMSKSPADRHATAADLLQDVEEALTALTPPTADTVSGTLVPKRAPAPRPANVRSAAPAPARARPGSRDEDEADEEEEEEDEPPVPLIVGAAVLLVIMIGAGLFLVTRPRASDEPPPVAVVTEAEPTPTATEPTTVTETTDTEAPTATEPPVETETAPPPPATETAPPPPATEAPPPPPATEAPPPPPTTETPPPPPRVTETAPPPPPVTETPPPPPAREQPVVFRFGGADRRSSQDAGSYRLCPEPFSELVTLHSERPRPLPSRVRFELSALTFRQGGNRPPPPGGAPGGSNGPPKLDALVWGAAPDGLIVVVGARPGTGPVDARADLPGVVGAVLALLPSNELRVGILSFAPGSAPAKRSADLFAAPVLSRKDWRYSPSVPVEVIVDTTEDGWRVEIAHGDQPAVVAEKAWTDRARADVARGLVFFADAANNDREGTVTVSAHVR